ALKQTDRNQSLRQLCNERDAWLTACAVHLIGDESLVAFRGDVERYSESRHQALAETSRVVLGVLDAAV
ncbi:MAG: hypothetical protein KKA42_03095, partial [candidate division Zixibacteria bacterium]|nr:hypothetical protein [candidate division Zixibacteria bacterium]